MASTDVSGLAGQVSGLQIQGPGLTTAARVELGDSDVTRVLPGELDPLVGANRVPAQRVESSEDGTTARVIGGTTKIGVDLDSEEPAERQIGRQMRGGEALFDTSPYTNAPAIDGHPLNEIAIAISGTVKYPADLEEAQALFEALRLGKPVNISVSAYVATKQGAYKEDKEGDSIVTGKVGLKLLSLALIAPEDL